MGRSRSLCRVALVTVVAVWLTVAWPSQSVPAGGAFGLDGLHRLFGVSAAFARGAAGAAPALAARPRVECPIEVPDVGQASSAAAACGGLVRVGSKTDEFTEVF